MGTVIAPKDGAEQHDSFRIFLAGVLAALAGAALMDSLTEVWSEFF